jgi:hypothetical protein
MRQKRNVKSESEERSIILFEHGKTLCQVENERNIELSFEHRKGRSQAENERNIELSFCNAILRKASVFFERIIGESLVMLFPKSQIFFQEKSRKDFDPLLGQVDYVYGSCWPERAICAILPPRQDAPEGRAYALRGT